MEDYCSNSKRIKEEEEEEEDDENMDEIKESGLISQDPSLKLSKSIRKVLCRIERANLKDGVVNLHRR